MASLVTSTEEVSAGGIDITTGSLSIVNGAQFNTNTYGKSNAGNIILNVDGALDITGGKIFSNVEAGGVGDAGIVTINSGSLTLQDGEISTSSRGQGNAGNIEITASDSVSVDNSFITSNIGDFNEVAAVGKVGSISLTAKSVSFTNTAQLQAGFFSNTRGKPGRISIEAEDSISFDGTDTGIFSDAYFGSIGGGSDIKLLAESISLTNGAILNADNSGEGNGGNIIIEANNLTLRNGRITAATLFGEGGNINLKVDELLQMRDNSLISAQAFEDANGGNIDINAGFVIAFPSQTPNDGNDIIASAERGDGGNININTQQIFGLQERRATEGNGTNDIDASSEFGLSGEVVISNLVDDINQGVVELPDNVVEPETVTAQACPAAGRVARGESSFTITGRGGLPALATDPLTSDLISIEGDDTAQSSQKSPKGLVTVTEQPNPPSSKDIIPARGMIVNEKGEIVLTAYPTPNTSQRTPNNLASCSRS
ncbi:S-layer family protein [Pleurocapsales cyanobacterium LEGE 06147]|nr:S-layer family protein [Pleurocapsales cyanobacterium LEGE 06147]